MEPCQLLTCIRQRHRGRCRHQLSTEVVSIEDDAVQQRVLTVRWRSRLASLKSTYCRAICSGSNGPPGPAVAGVDGIRDFSVQSWRAAGSGTRTRDPVVVERGSRATPACRRVPVPRRDTAFRRANARCSPLVGGEGFGGLGRGRELLEGCEQFAVGVLVGPVERAAERVGDARRAGAQCRTGLGEADQHAGLVSLVRCRVTTPWASSRFSATAVFSVEKTWAPVDCTQLSGRMRAGLTRPQQGRRDANDRERSQPANREPTKGPERCWTRT